jgi:hypothetical protein
MAGYCFRIQRRQKHGSRIPEEVQYVRSTALVTVWQWQEEDEEGTAQ